jgi:SAM-dependent methyltransferase
LSSAPVHAIIFLRPGRQCIKSVTVSEFSELGENQVTWPFSRYVLAANHIPLTPGARVLHFGCGTGRHVTEWRAEGFDAVGVDRPIPALIEECRTARDGGHIFFSSASGDFPFKTSTFDFCTSTSVLEHVMEYDKPFSEIARVLKPGAYSLHVFPARWRPIEPHMFTPLGGRFQNPAILKIWASLGIRNSFQQGLGAAETAERNRIYSLSGINYPTAKQIEAAFRHHFHDVRFVERDFVVASKGVSRASRLAGAFIGIPGVEALYRGLHTRAVLAGTTGVLYPESPEIQ